MKFKRALLSAELGVLAPALSDNAKIPGLDCLWFDGEKVSAYNDIIGIEKPLKTEFAGGIPGKVLLGYLDKINGEEVDLEVEETGEEDRETGEKYEDLKISCGRSRLKLPLSNISGRLWTLPERDNEGITLTKDLLNLLSMMLMSVGKGAVDPEFLGITFEPYQKALNLFSSDAVALSWGNLPLPKNYACERVTIPTEFCERMIKLCGPENNLYLSETCAIAENSAGTMLYGRMLGVENPRNFRSVLSKHLGENPSMMDIPEGLDHALDRACLLQTNKDPVLVSLVGEKLGLYISTDLGELRDILEVQSDSDEKFSVYFDPVLLKRGLDDRSLFLLNKESIVMRGPENFVHVLAARVSK